MTADTLQVPGTALPPRTQQTFVALTADERRRLQRLAEHEQRSISATARLLILNGLDRHDAGQPLST